MKKSEVKSKNKHLIVVNLFLISILMVVGVYAWFASQADNRVDAYDIQVESDNALELSFDQTTWGGTLNLADYKIDNTNVLDSMKFVEVTGEGTNFQIPQLTQKENYAEVNTSGVWKTATANKDYLQFTVYMRSKDKLNVYLGSGSQATPASSVLTGANCGNPSSYTSGDNAFSKDCIVGALRVAVKDSTDAQKFIWITNPNFHLDNKIGSSDYSMDTKATSTSYSAGTGAVGNYFVWNNPYEHYYHTTSGPVKYSGTLLTEIPDTQSGIPTATTTQIAQLTGEPDANGYYTSQATFTVWIEGCDTEARRALVDGKFDLTLAIDSFTLL